MCVSKYSISSFFMNLIYISLVLLCFLVYSVRINRFLYLSLACGSYPCLNSIVIKEKNLFFYTLAFPLDTYRFVFLFMVSYTGI